MEEIGTSNLIETWGSSGTSVKPDSSKIAEGWQLGEQPPHEWMNWLQNTFGQKINHLLKNGNPLWNEETTYLIGATVQYSGDSWTCKAANVNSIPSINNSNWKQIITSEIYSNGLGKQGYTHTASATFTSIDNKIVMTGIVSALGLEAGDVITFSNANALNNKAHTIESITDNNTIIVNYEHCGSRGNGSLKLFNQTVTLANCKLLAKWFVAPIGLGQDWVAVNRTLDATNINNLNRSIIARIIATTGVSTIVGIAISNIAIDQASGVGISAISTIPVNVDFSYALVTGGSVSEVDFRELR